MAFDPFRLRSVPNSMDGFQAISFLFSNRCQAPAFVYWETVLPVLGTAIIRLSEFGPEDVISGYFRPIPNRTGKHFRRPRRNRNRLPGIPDVGGEIGRMLPGAKDAGGRHVTDGVRNLWFGYGIIENFNNNLLMADIASDSLVSWAQLIRLRACRPPGKAGMMARRAATGAIGLLGCNGVGQMVQEWPVPGQPQDASWTFHDRGGMCTFSASIGDTFNATNARVTLNTSEGIRGSSTILASPQQGDYLIASAYIPRNKTCTALVCCDTGFVTFEDCFFTANSL